MKKHVLNTYEGSTELFVLVFPYTAAEYGLYGSLNLHQDFSPPQQSRPEGKSVDYDHPSSVEITSWGDNDGYELRRRYLLSDEKLRVFTFPDK